MLTSPTSAPAVPRVDALHVAIYADGADLAAIKAHLTDPVIAGFTTNPTLMRKAGIADYERFARDVLAVVTRHPISFEVFADDEAEMERQARLIATWGANVFVKIPVTDTKGKSTAPLVHRLSADGVQLNVTALMTTAQVQTVTTALAGGAPAFISVFAGRVADTGRDPLPIMIESLEIMRGHKQLRLIWASPRELLNVFEADRIGCHVITVTSDILAKLKIVGKSLDDYSLDTVRMFHDDAVRARLSPVMAAQRARWPVRVAPYARKAALLAALVKRELESRYRGSLLGRSWPLATQLAQLIVFTYLFSAIFRVRLHIDGIGENAATYGLWLFAGVVPWTAFSVAVAQSASSVLGQTTLIKKVVFPLALLPLVPVLAAFIESLAGLLALIVLFAIVAHTVYPTLALLPLIWLPQLLLTGGLAYFCGGLTVFVRDIQQALTPILLVWFYLTAVVYPLSIVPARMLAFTAANPMTFIVDATRDVVIYGRGFEPRAWTLDMLISAAIFALGFLTYRALRPAFADVL